MYFAPLFTFLCLFHINIVIEFAFTSKSNRVMFADSAVIRSEQIMMKIPGLVVLDTDEEEEEDGSECEYFKPSPWPQS